MTAVSTSAIDPDGVLSRVGRRAVQSDLTTLVAVRGVDGPCRLVPARFEVVGDLSEGEREREERKEGG